MTTAARLYCWLTSTSADCKSHSGTVNDTQQWGSYQLSPNFIPVPVSAEIGTCASCSYGQWRNGNSPYWRLPNNTGKCSTPGTENLDLKTVTSGISITDLWRITLLNKTKHPKIITIKPKTRIYYFQLDCKERGVYVVFLYIFAFGWAQTFPSPQISFKNCHFIQSIPPRISLSHAFYTFNIIDFLQKSWKILPYLPVFSSIYLLNPECLHMKWRTASMTTNGLWRPKDINFLPYAAKCIIRLPEGTGVEKSRIEGFHRKFSSSQVLLEMQLGNGWSTDP